MDSAHTAMLAASQNGRAPAATAGAAPPPEARRTLREAGLRVTEQRLQVFEALRRATRPVSHPELVAQLPEDGMDRTTVYRILMDLTERGLANRRDLGDHVWRFDLRTDARRHEMDHPHFSCTACGALECLPEGAVQLSAQLAAAVQGRLAEVQLRGRCARCTA